MGIIYREQSYLWQEQSWIWYILGLEVVLISALLIGLQAPWAAIILSLGLMALVAWLFSRICLDASLTAEGVYIRYVPHQWRVRTYSPDEILTVSTFTNRKDKPMNIGYSKRKNQIWYVTHHKQGIKLSLASGSEINVSMTSRENWIYHFRRLQEEHPAWRHVKLDFQT